ncbi:adenylosuccinate lyase [Synechococcus sp. UW140]|nr:adenylosuccinate lyase [Synechococcus sp. UW140]
MFWTPYADWIYVVVSLSGLAAVTWLVLRPGPDN